MTLETAVSIIRNNYPNQLIWSGFEYGDLFLFFVAADNKFIPGDSALHCISVNRKTKETEYYPFWKNIIKDLKLARAAKSAILVDITQEQANMRE